MYDVRSLHSMFTLHYVWNVDYVLFSHQEVARLDQRLCKMKCLCVDADYCESMMIFIVHESCIEIIEGLHHFCDCKLSASSSRKVGMPHHFWALRESPFYIYHSLCPNPLSFLDGVCTVVCVCSSMSFLRWFHIVGSSTHCIPFIWIYWLYRVLNHT